MNDLAAGSPAHIIAALETGDAGGYCPGAHLQCPLSVKARAGCREIVFDSVVAGARERVAPATDAGAVRGHHRLALTGVYAPDGDGKGQMFHPAPAPSQQDVEQVVERASKRILRFLQRRGVITLVTAPGDGEVTVVTDDTMGEKDPLLARLLAAALLPAAADAAKATPGAHDDGGGGDDGGELPSVGAIDPNLPWPALLLALTGQDVLLCPRCQQRTIVRQLLPPTRGPPRGLGAP